MTSEATNDARRPQGALARAARAAGWTLLVLGLGLGLGWLLWGWGAGAPGAGGADLHPGHEHGAAPAAEQEWTCSMHPQIRQPKPGRCPLCGMDLIPVPSGGGAEDGDGGPAATLQLSPRARALASVRTATVRRGEARRELRLYGRIGYDESRETTLTAWVGGRIERLHVAALGERVRRGQPLVTLYSPELVAAQHELLQTLRASQQLERSSVASLAAGAQATLAAARDRLRRWGMSAAQVAALERSGAVEETLTLRAPQGGVIVHRAAQEGLYVATGTPLFRLAELGRVWAQLEVYEQDLPWVIGGQAVEMVSDALPGQVLRGTVGFVDPVVDPKTRTLRLRVELDNQAGLLRPEMFLRARLEARIDAAGQTLPDDAVAELPLLVPYRAPLLTGRRAVVYVAVPGEAGRYEGREVQLGPRAGDDYVVLAGLAEGEEVVVEGNFKIDSALQILARPSMMSPAAPPATAEQAVAQATPSAAPAPWAPLPDLQRGLDTLLGAYFSIHAALSQDDLAGAQAGARLLGERLAALRLPASAGAELRRGWADLAQRLESSSARLAAAAAIEPARSAFEPLSDALTEAVRRAGTSGAQPVLRFFCPMAFDDKGAFWLQSREGVANPYFGSAMFGCGEQTAVLVAAGGRG